MSEDRDMVIKLIPKSWTKFIKKLCKATNRKPWSLFCVKSKFDVPVVIPDNSSAMKCSTESNSCK